jgi:microcystin-dependent protein
MTSILRQNFSKPNITAKPRKLHPKAIAYYKKLKADAAAAKAARTEAGIEAVETPPYFPNPFAVNGDTAAIPQTTQPSGEVSYQQGYGPDYELDLLTNPDALPIGRETMNQLFFDITTLLQQYSQYGTPLFITTAQNLGTPFPYPQYAVTYYGGQRYENQVADNTATPGTDNSWLLISGDATGVLTGMAIPFCGFTAPAGYLLCDGSAVSRTTYGALLSVISQTQTGTTTNTLFTVSGLSNTAYMYVGMPLESANFPPGTTVASIVDSTDITTSQMATASGAVSIQFFNFGNGDGSTTFNVPDSRRTTWIGAGGTASGTPFGVAGTVTGQSGGQEAHTLLTAELAAHTHDVSGTLVSGSGIIVGGGAVISGTTTSSTTGSSTPFNVMQPSLVVTAIIKT